MKMILRRLSFLLIGTHLKCLKYLKVQQFFSEFFFFLFQRLPQSPLLQLAPSVEHQSSAMLSILKRYSWHKFAIVTSHIGGHDDFIRAVRDQVLATVDFKYECLNLLYLYFIFTM